MKAFTCQTGIHVKDVAMGSVDAGRQITAGARLATCTRRPTTWTSICS